MAAVPMTDLHKKAIQKATVTLVNHMNPDVSTYIHSSDVFTIPDRQDINRQGTRTGKVSKIIEILFTKEDKAFDAFCKALSETGQMCLAIELRGNLSQSSAGEDFDPTEDSTEGIKLEPSYLKLQVQPWESMDCSEKVLFERCVADTMAEHLKLEDTKIYPIPSRSDKEKKEYEQQTVLANPPKTPKKIGDDEESQRIGNILPWPLVEDRPENKEQPDETKVPNNISALVEHRLKNKGQNDEEKDIALTVLDFAGQQAYYNIHPVFMSPKAVYVLVYNLENDLHAEATSTVGCGGKEYPVDEHCPQTNINHLQFWLSCVESICGDRSATLQSQVREADGIKLPPVFLTCTHVDEVIKKGINKELITTEILQTLTDEKRTSGKHLVWRIFTVDNTKSGKGKEDEEIERLRKCILQIVADLPQLQEDIPIGWLKFEKELASRTESWINRDDARQLAEKCNVETGSNEFETLLNYLHDLKVVIHFDDTHELDNMVIIKPTWLLDMFVKVITVVPIVKRNQEYNGLWRKLESSGVLDMALVKHLWNDIASNEQTVKALLSIMQKFSLVCEWKESDVFLVPSMLKSPAVKEVQVLFQKMSSAVPPIVVQFTSGHLPLGFFPRFVVFLVDFCATTWRDCKKPKLFSNLAKCDDLGMNMEFSVVVVSDMSTITVWVDKDETSTGKDHQQFESFSDFCRTVFEFLKSTLEKMCKEFPWMSHVKTKFCVHCFECLQKAEPCKNHQVRGCRRDECMHYITENELCSTKVSCCAIPSRLEDPVIDRTKFSHWFEFCGEKLPKSSKTTPPSRPDVQCPSAVDAVIRWRRGKPKDVELHDLADDLPDWQRFGSQLGVAANKIRGIDNNNVKYVNIQQKGYAMLALWKSSGFSQTYKKLGEALVALGEIQLAAKHFGRKK